MFPPPLRDSFQGRSLRGLTFNLTLYWNVMPKIGSLRLEKATFPGFTLPPDYQMYSQAQDPVEDGDDQFDDVVDESEEREEVY